MFFYCEGKLKNLLNFLVLVGSFCCFQNPLLNYLSISSFVDLYSLLSCKFLPRYHEKENQTETKNIRFKCVWRNNFARLSFDEFGSQKGYGSMDCCFFNQLCTENFATASIAQFQFQFICVHDQDIFWFYVTVGYVDSFELAKAFEEKLKYIIDLFFCYNLFLFSLMVDKIV